MFDADKNTRIKYMDNMTKINFCHQHIKDWFLLLVFNLNNDVEILHYI